MQVGYNHNIKHNGKVYHLQTEDNGKKSKSVTTLLYCSGAIISSKTTNYSPLMEKSDYAKALIELMQNQHRQMLLDLINGDFDDNDSFQSDVAH